MSAQLNNSDNKPVLCIPGVFANIKEERIRRIFGDLNLGEVDRVDIVVPKTPVEAGGKENKFNRVFIHLNWNDTPSSVACRKKLSEGKEVKIIYDEPWFWKVSAYRPPAPKPKFQSHSKPKTFQPKKATLELDFEPAEVRVVASITSPRENEKEPKSPTGPPPSQNQDATPPINYGKVQAPPKRKQKIILDQTKEGEESD